MCSIHPKQGAWDWEGPASIPHAAGHGLATRPPGTRGATLLPEPRQLMQGETRGFKPLGKSESQNSRGWKGPLWVM